MMKKKDKTPIDRHVVAISEEAHRAIRIRAAKLNIALYAMADEMIMYADKHLPPSK